MGTNYFWREDPCSKCGRGDEIHIGKSSAGWEFSFHGTDEIRSWKGWQDKLQSGGLIFDEYGREVSLDDFRNTVENRSHPSGLKNHTDYCAKHHPFSYEVQWKDDEGYSFSPGEFS
jgi:hypothetical protein